MALVAFQHDDSDELVLVNPKQIVGVEYHARCFGKKGWSRIECLDSKHYDVKETPTEIHEKLKDYMF